MSARAATALRRLRARLEEAISPISSSAARRSHERCLLRERIEADRARRRMTPEYLEFLAGIGASKSLQESAARALRDQARAERRPRARGQALVEFALVMPVLFAVIFSFIVLATFTADGSILNHAAVSGARAGNDGMGAINAKITNTSTANVSMLLAPYPFAGNSNKAYGPYSTSTTGVTRCLKTRNAAVYKTIGGEVYNNNTDVLAWDWGPRMCGGTQAVITDADLQGPLYAAAKQADDTLRALVLGPNTGITVTACYADSAGNCILGLGLQDSGGAPVASGLLICTGLKAAPYSITQVPCSSVSFQTEPAPSFMRVDAAVTVIALTDIPLVRWFGVPGSVSLRSHAIEVLDRFLPACPAINYKTGGKAAPAGSCGSIY